MSFTACANNTATNDAAKLLTEAKATQFFTDESVADANIEKILSAGVNAPSAMNTQPWHFTAVTDKETQTKLADAMQSMKPPAMNGDAPLTIVISCKEGSELDAGLAVQNMSAEAQLLGYGTKIMTAPTMARNNAEYKELLSVPEGQKIVAVLLVGKAASAQENPDAVSSATTRNAFDEMVTVISK